MTCDHVWGPADARGQHKGPVVQSDGTRQGSNTQITGSEGRPWISTLLILLFSTCLWYDKLKPPPWRSWHYCISVQNINSTWQLRGCRLKRGAERGYWHMYVIKAKGWNINPNPKKKPKHGVILQTNKTSRGKGGFWQRPESCGLAPLWPLTPC